MEISPTNERTGAGVPTCTAGQSPAVAFCRRLLLTVTVALVSSLLSAQSTSGKTVRHHKVAVEDPSSPPELIQAEAAIEKQDYVTAEPLLKKVVTDDPQNF